jgi:hypothetical protein
MDENLTPLQRFFLAFVAFFSVLFNARFALEVHQARLRQRGQLPAPGPGSEPARAAAPTPAPEVGVIPPGTPAGKPPLEEAGPPRASTATVTVEPSDARPAPAARAAEAPAVRPPPIAAAATATPPALRPVPAGPSPESIALHVLGLLQRDGRLVDFVSESLEGFSDSEIGAAARTVHAGCRKTLDAYVTLEPVFREPEGASVSVAPGFDASAVRLTGNVVGAPPFKGSLRHHGWRVTQARFPLPPDGHDVRILAPAEVEL